MTRAPAPADGSRGPAPPGHAPGMQTTSPSAEPVVIRSKNGNWYKRHPNGAVTCRVLHVGPNRSERLRIACLARREKRRAARAAARTPAPGWLVLDERASNAKRIARSSAIGVAVTRPGLAGSAPARLVLEGEPVVVGADVAAGSGGSYASAVAGIAGHAIDEMTID
jgi:hypothetical protein